MKEVYDKPKILVVDDSPSNIQILVEILASDHEIAIFTDGSDALRVTATFKPDLILLDIEMPELDGYEVCVKLKADPNTKDIPIIFLTARHNEQDEAKGLSLGAIDYITKPFSPAVVVARVRNQLELKRHRDAMEEMAKELRAAKEVAEKASQAKGEFLVRQVFEISSQDATLAGTPPKVILLTDSRKEEDTKSQAKAMGVNAFLSKPVSCSLLFDTVMELFGKKVPKVYRSGREAIDLTGITEKIGGAQVLLVEDNAINQQVAREMLENVGLFVTVVGDGLEATQMVMESSFELVLMDIQMPRMDGYTACRQIRANPRFKKLPIIAMTTHAMDGDRQKCIHVGMNDHIAKPIDRKHLYATLIAWIKPANRPRVKIAPPLKRMSEVDKIKIPAILPGVDVVSGLERLGGNHHLFRSLLLSFGREFATASAKVQAALEGRRQDDLKVAKDLIHTIKGMAGNLSALELFDAILALEKGICADRREDWPKLLNGFEFHLQRIFKSIETLKPEEKEAPSGKDSKPIKITPLKVKEITPPLIELAHAIRMDATKSLAYFDALKPLLEGAGFGCVLRQLEESLNVFDFKKAQDHLAVIFRVLKISQDVEKKQ